MKLGLVLLTLIIGCKKDPPAVCDAYVEKEIACSPQLAKSAHEKVRSSSMQECTRAIEDEAANEMEAPYFKRLQHDAGCAKSSATCDAYEQCKDGFDIAGALRGTNTR